MITNPNGSKRFQDSDLVHTTVFNTVLDSFDRVAITKNNIGVTQSPQQIFSFTPSNLFTNNLCISFYVNTTAQCALSATLSYSDNSGVQTINILNGYTLSSPNSYSFSPIYISATNNQPVSLTVYSGNTTGAVTVSSSAVYF